MSIRKALEELLIIVVMHQKCTKNNFAWAEVEYAKELLAQPEPKREPLSDDEIILAYRELVKKAIGRFQKTKPAQGIGVDDE